VGHGKDIGMKTQGEAGVIVSGRAMSGLKKKYRARWQQLVCVSWMSNSKALGVVILALAKLGTVASHTGGPVRVSDNSICDDARAGMLTKSAKPNTVGQAFYFTLEAVP
jgi:hypothetical protein